VLARALFFLTLPYLMIGQQAAFARRSNAVEAYPSYYAYHPRSVMSLGLGFNPSDISQAKIRCIHAEVNCLENGALTTEFATLYITNYEQTQAGYGRIGFQD
jgi:hypothetical protein